MQEQKGKITIKFHPIDEKYVLIVADDGIGFPENIDFENTKTLGLQLINIYRENGTLFKIIF